MGPLILWPRTRRAVDIIVHLIVHEAASFRCTWLGIIRGVWKGSISFLSGYLWCHMRIHKLKTNPAVL